MAPRTLLIPSFLDDHFPLLRHAFASDCWQSVLLPPEAGLANLGLRYLHRTGGRRVPGLMPYPAIAAGPGPGGIPGNGPGLPEHPWH